MSRIIGIRHRVKFSAEGEARPTQVAIVDGENATLYDLSDEQAELDFVLGRFPTKLRKLEDGEDLSIFAEHHIVKRKNGTFVPELYDGLQSGDKVAMVLGGSGDYFAFALSRRGTDIGAEVCRIPSFTLADARGEANKEDDAVTLASLLAKRQDLFYSVTERDRELILVREGLRMRTDAMKARIACEQRLRQRFIGMAFCNDKGGFPEGAIEKSFAEEVASDDILQALLEEEKRREKDLVKAIGRLDVYTEIFEPIEGCGPMIAARIIASIVDIRRFATDAKLKAYAGVHVMEDGRIPRRRHGHVANWHPDIRQGLYLLGDQFNRRPNSYWGKELRKYKAALRERHPEVTVVKGKKRYTDGHIHKMALWRTITRFTEWLFKAWWDLEKSSDAKKAEAA